MRIYFKNICIKIQIKPKEKRNVRALCLAVFSIDRKTRAAYNKSINRKRQTEDVKGNAHQRTKVYFY